MKKIFTSIIILSFFTNSFAQDNYIKRPSLEIRFFFIDFKTAADIRTNGLANVVRDKSLFKTARMNGGLAVNYIEGLSKHVDFITGLGGSILSYPIQNHVPFINNHLLLEGTAAVNLRLLSDKYYVVPFIDVGVGASTYEGIAAAFLPVGVGIQGHLFGEAYILINSQYRIPVTQGASYHFYHSIGFMGPITAKKTAPPKVVQLPVAEVKDRDADGIVDSLDACPDEAGPASLNGCPDRDGDGIADKDDKCPDVAGLAKYNGCPIPDTDNDGINDEEDKCPTVPGVARYQGCPIPDTDNDGVNDEEDKCPNEPGPASNFGCPEIKPEIIEKVNLAAKNIFFATGSAKLLAKSYPSLNNVVKILTENPTFKVDIAGHTDITGTHEKNMVLSDNRAASVKAYLVSKGIDESRITSQGFGPDKPIADNKTAAGRAKNRRVEMKLRNY
jgi:outer membrane protein OmpA-like peptidoglycan-associated protein